MSFPDAGRDSLPSDGVTGRKKRKEVREKKEEKK